MNLIKLFEDSNEEFGNKGHIVFHPYLWHTAMQDPEFVNAIELIRDSGPAGPIAKVKGIRIFISCDPTPGSVYQDRIMKALVALQAPELLEFI